MRYLTVLCCLVVSGGCAPSTSCDEGSLVCRDDAVQRCIGPSEGGDADGDLVLVETCATGTMCWIDVTDTERTGGCVEASCFDRHGPDSCFAAGQSNCSLGLVEVCTADTDGCLHWEIERDCTDTDEECTFVAGNATCTAP